jgi:hypothetical protein
MFLIVSLTEVLVDGAIPILRVTSAGTSINGVAVLNVKLSRSKLSLT